MMPNNDTPQGVDCSSLEGLYEAALILLANSHKVADWTNGDENTDVELGGKPTPSIRKLVALLNGIAGIATATTPGAVMPDGETITIDGLGKLSAIKATLQSLGIVQPDGVTTMVGENGLIQALGGNLLLNSEQWITESGEWEAPVMGWFSILAIDGGNAATANVNNQSVHGGDSGDYKSALAFFHKGQKVQITIGAGGIVGGNYVGGKTIVDGVDFSVYENTKFKGETIYKTSTLTAYSKGAGFGGTELYNSNSWYGAGGYGVLSVNNTTQLDNGTQGGVRFRWHDPAKANGPVPEPALLSARRMAPRAAAAPVTVNLYDPETGQGSVWREEDAEAKMAEGLIGEEAWLEICAAKAAEEHAAWLADPNTGAERFEMLRRARDAKLAATDYLVAPDYPLTDEQRAAVTEYRQALRDLPAQAGAPWDGGGEDTPWPTMPTIEKAE